MFIYKKVAKIFLIALIILCASYCKSPNEPIKEKNKWEDITFDLAGKKLKNIKQHKDKLYLSTLHEIYQLTENDWKLIIDAKSYYIADFEFNNDTLFVLTMTNELLYQSGDSLNLKYKISKPHIIDSKVLLFSNNDCYIGGTAQLPYKSGLSKLSKNGHQYDYLTENYNTSYFVHEIIEHKNKIYIGTLIITGYFVAELNLDNDILKPIGIKKNGYSFGACYSMFSLGEQLLVGTKGKVLSYDDKYGWTIYKDKLPHIKDTELKEKALCMDTKEDTLLVGTLYSGILYFDDSKESWVNFFNEGLPEDLAINAIVAKDEGIYVLIGHYNFDDTFSNKIYRLTTAK
ncbi:MAG: hypothetical protein CR986_05275 [Ignavibacteriae bacterium]|nr:MAG: hypothetical protein CR986_05275 [Ignavibacteriota bacterium]